MMKLLFILILPPLLSSVMENEKFQLKLLVFFYLDNVVSFAFYMEQFLKILYNCIYYDFGIEGLPM